MSLRWHYYLERGYILCFHSVHIFSKYYYDYPIFKKGKIEHSGSTWCMNKALEKHLILFVHPFLKNMAPLVNIVQLCAQIWPFTAYIPTEMLMIKNCFSIFKKPIWWFENICKILVILFFCFYLFSTFHSFFANAAQK